jgi:capsular exopolysaccharide synthesis family protein
MTAIEIRPPYPEQEHSLQDTWHLLVRNRGLIIGCTALVVAASAIWAYTATPVYEASTSIRIDEERSHLPVLEALQQLSSGSDLVTEMEVLNSRSLAENVVDSLALRAVLAKPSRVERQRIFSLLTVSPNAPSGALEFTRKSDGAFLVSNRRNHESLGAATPGSQFVAEGVTLVLREGSGFNEITLSVVPLQTAVKDLRKRLSVTRPSRTANVVVVRHEGTDPSLVREVPNVLADRFIMHRREVQTTEARSVARFLRQQLDTLSLQLTAAENTLQNFRQQAQVVNLPAEGTAQVTRLANLQGERSSINAERSALAALLTEIRAAAATQKPDDPSPYRRMLAFPTLFKNTSTNETLRALTDLEDQRSALLVRRTPKDPDVIALTSRIKELEQQLQTVGETYLQGLTNQVAALDASLAQFGAQLQKIPAKEVEFARLERRPKILEEIYTLLQTRLKEAEITQAAEDPTVRVVDAAILPINPVRPKTGLVISMAAFLGLMLSIGAAFAREMMDRTVHTKEDVYAFTGATVLGLIPRIPRASTELRGPTLAMNRLLRRATPGLVSQFSSIAPNLSAGQDGLNDRLVTGADPRSPVSEAYRSLRTNITFARPDQVSKTLVFTSPMPGDGKTTSAANLAITLAQQGVKILLIDGDLRRGVLNNVFSTPREPGLSNVLLGVGRLDQAIQSIDLGENGSLDFLSTGTLPPNPAELLGSHKMRNLLSELEEKYDAIIVDSPPLNVVTDAAVLGTVADGVVLVARAGITEKSGLMYAAEQLANVHAPLLGAVLNDVDFESNRYYGMYGKYGYYQYNYRYQAQEPRAPVDIPVPFLPKA